MPRTILRHKQRTITAVTPAPNQGRWINPQKRNLGITLPVFFFGTTSFAESVLTATLNAGAVWEISLRLQADIPLGGNQILLATDNTDFRI